MGKGDENETTNSSAAGPAAEKPDATAADTTSKSTDADADADADKTGATDADADADTTSKSNDTGTESRVESKEVIRVLPIRTIVIEEKESE
jgi:hypothetical protein